MDPLDGEIGQRFEFARNAAREAGRLTLSYFLSDLQVERKADDSPVTVADRETERWLRNQIQTNFPRDGIVGEEFPEQPGQSGFCWILDPIDGTKSFICGVPLYATLIGLQFEDRPVVGIIELPALQESLAARVGGGAWWTRGDRVAVPARVAKFATIADGLVTTSERATFDRRGAAEVFRRLEAASLTARTWGDAYGYALVATGRAAVMIDPIMSVWDAAALAPVLSEAGGGFTDWRGTATIHAGEGLGTTPELLPQVLEIIRDAAAGPQEEPPGEASRRQD